jgi:hypothetical protein
LAVAVLLGTCTAAWSAAPPTASEVTTTALATGNATLLAGRSYVIAACTPTSSPTALFVQSATGRWMKVATSAPPVIDKDACPMPTRQWRATYDWTVNQLGIPGAPDGPNRLEMATGVENPRFLFTAGVWPSASR